MSSKRKMQICEMIQGNIELISGCLDSKNELVRMDAILWAAYHNCNDESTVSRIKELKTDSSGSMGYTVGDYAVAALDRLNIEKYSGNDRYMKAFIDGFIPTKQEAENILRNNSAKTA